jgi:hypothetical protein
MNTVEKLISLYKKNNYELQENNLIPNLFGVRASCTKNTGIYPKDFIGLLFKDNDIWNYIITPAYTTLENFLINSSLHTLGIYILKPGQYKDVYKIGYHKLKFEALRQIKDMTYYFISKENKEERTINLFSNLHKATSNLISNNLNKYNNGSQIITNYYDFLKIQAMLKKAADSYSPYFSYTLFEESEL